MGLTSVSFKTFVTEGVSSPPAYTNLLPGDLAIGNFETGVTLASTECINATTGTYMDPVIFATIDLFSVGGVGDVMILEHPDFPGWVLDCEPGEALIDSCCVWTHGGVGKDAEPGDAECAADTPVEARTWGAIKALYN